jgi:hypothetical protein
MERLSLSIVQWNKCGQISTQNLNRARLFGSFEDTMGIPADYNDDDDDYRKGAITIPPVNSMLPIPRTKETPKECVGKSEKINS